MGIARKLRTFNKENERIQNPSVARREKAYKELEDFYRTHPHIATHLAERVGSLRDQCKKDIETISLKADDDITRTEAVFLEKELETVKGLMPEAEKPRPARNFLSGLFALFGKKT